MGPVKEQYLRRIRSESAYPAFRSLIMLVALLMYLLGGLIILASVGLGLFQLAHQPAQGLGTLVVGVLGGVIYIAMGKVTKEAAYMLADVADSITDLNCRYDQQQPR